MTGSNVEKNKHGIYHISISEFVKIPIGQKLQLFLSVYQTEWKFATGETKKEGVF